MEEGIFRKSTALEQLYGNTARLYGISAHMTVLAQLICSNVRSEIFRVLLGLNENELHLREIQRQTGFAIGTVRQDIGKLVNMGLIVRRKDGNRVYCKANIEHPLYGDIHQMVLKTVGLTDVLVDALKSDEIKCAFVFGSVADGTEQANSDIDLVVISDIGLRKVSAMLSGVGTKLGREINPHVYNPVEFKSRIAEKDHFLMSILNTNKMFIKGSENVLKGLGE